MATLPSTSALPLTDVWTAADLQQHLGDIPADRIRIYPPPGTATEKDVIEAHDRFDRLCELVDGVLVEKTMGMYESLLAGLIIQVLNNYLQQSGLGFALAPDGTLKILPDQVRIPDVCFISWDRLPDRKLPKAQIPALVPDLAIEVLSPSNTRREMERKLCDYFTAGVLRVWLIDPATRTAKSYSDATHFEAIGGEEELSADELLPGFRLSLSDLFARADAPPA